MTIINSTRMCSGCNQSINDLYFLDVGSKFYWHLACLKCSDCSCLLELQTKCYLNDGKFYCPDDYAKLRNQIKANMSLVETLSILNNEENLSSNNRRLCRNCKMGISSNEYVIRLKLGNKNDDMRNSVLYHLNCFLCNQCNKLISPGHQHGILDEKIYCRQHYFEKLNQHQQIYQNKIYNCNNNGMSNINSLNYIPIKDETEAHKIDTQMFQYSHHHHQQHHFNQPIHQDQNVLQHSLIEDYDHKINRVGQDENNNLNKLTGYCLNQEIIDLNNNNEKHSEEHHFKAEQANNVYFNNHVQSIPPPPPPPPTQISSESCLNKNKSKANGSISNSGRKINNSIMLMNGTSSSGGGSSSSSSSKKKRMRTSFKHQQLRIMKAHFQINQNPDSKELKELSEKTGLPKRVLQVWFQNSRAKQRKTTPTQSLTPSTLLINKNRNTNLIFSGAESDMKSSLTSNEYYKTPDEENDDGLEIDDENFELDEMSSDDIDDRDENDMNSGDDNDDVDDENDNEKNENLDSNFKRPHNKEKLSYLDDDKVKQSQNNSKLPNCKKTNMNGSVLSEQIVHDNYFKSYEQNQLHPDHNLIQGIQHSHHHHHHHHQNTIIDFYHCY